MCSTGERVDNEQRGAIEVEHDTTDWIELKERVRQGFVL